MGRHVQALPDRLLLSQHSGNHVYQYSGACHPRKERPCPDQHIDAECQQPNCEARPRAKHHVTQKCRHQAVIRHLCKPVHKAKNLGPLGAQPWDLGQLSKDNGSRNFSACKTGGMPIATFASLSAQETTLQSREFPKLPSTWGQCKVSPPMAWTQPSLAR